MKYGTAAGQILAVNAGMSVAISDGSLEVLRWWASRVREAWMMSVAISDGSLEVPHTTHIPNVYRSRMSVAISDGSLEVSAT